MPMQRGIAQHICYTSPDWGHPLNKRDPRAAYEAFLEFLTTCTDCDCILSSGHIEVSPVGEFLPEHWSDSAARRQLCHRFGDPTTNLYINSTPIPSWPVSAKEHEWAVDFALSQPAAKRGYPDPVTFNTSYEFLLRNPDTGLVIPGQEHGVLGQITISSNALLFIASGKVTATLELRFPYAEADDSFLGLFSIIRPYLPFRLSRSRFRVWIPKKDGSGYRHKVVDPELFAQL